MDTYLYIFKFYINCSFLIFFQARENQWLCRFVHLGLRFAILSNVFWMFVEGIYLHNRIAICVFRNEANMKLFYFMGWGKCNSNASNHIPREKEKIVDYTERKIKYSFLSIKFLELKSFFCNVFKLLSGMVFSLFCYSMGRTALFVSVWPMETSSTKSSE